MRRISHGRLAALLLPVVLLGAGQFKSAAQLAAPGILNAPKHLLFLYGNVPHAIAISVATIRAMPQVKVKAALNGSGKSVTYSGVPVVDLVPQTGLVIDTQPAAKAPFSLIAIGGAGKQVVISPSDANSLLHNGNEFIVADAVNGKPLPVSAGPLELVIAGDKDSSRWVQNLTRIKIDSAK